MVNRAVRDISKIAITAFHSLRVAFKSILSLKTLTYVKTPQTSHITPDRGAINPAAPVLCKLCFGCHKATGPTCFLFVSFANTINHYTHSQPQHSCLVSRSNVFVTSTLLRTSWVCRVGGRLLARQPHVHYCGSTI